MRNPRVAIVTAIPPELAAMRELVKVNDDDEYTDPREGSVYSKGTFSAQSPRQNCAIDWDVFLPMPSSATNVLSAIAAEKVSSAVVPDVIIMVGCAGGIPGKANLYDVVVADKVFYYEPGKTDVELLPRPDQARPAHRLLERAKAEHFTNRWLQYLGTHKPSETPVVRVEPIAAGELLIKNSNDGYLAHVLKVSPRSIAVEQEGYGVLMAAHKNGVHAIVVRGISDLLDDKGSDATENLSEFNPKQVKAARHAGAFALSMLANLDVTWIKDARYQGATQHTTVKIVLEGDLTAATAVHQQLLDWLQEGKIKNVTFTRGSINAEFEVEPGHALILRAAFEAGILIDIAERRIIGMNVSPSSAPLSAQDLVAQIGNIDLEASEHQSAIVGLRAPSAARQEYGRIIDVVLKFTLGKMEERRKLRASSKKRVEAMESERVGGVAQQIGSVSGRRAKLPSGSAGSPALLEQPIKRQYRISGPRSEVVVEVTGFRDGVAVFRFDWTRRPASGAVAAVECQLILRRHSRGQDGDRLRMVRAESTGAVYNNVQTLHAYQLIDVDDFDLSGRVLESDQ